MGFFFHGFLRRKMVGGMYVTLLFSEDLVDLVFFVFVNGMGAGFGDDLGQGNVVGRR